MTASETMNRWGTCGGAGRDFEGFEEVRGTRGTMEVNKEVGFIGGDSPVVV